MTTALTRIREDVCTALEKDPAAESVLAVLTYPGLHAVWLHHVEHWLWERGYHVLARALSHLMRFLTGVEIHPGADLGRRVFVDHGMGTVIGETAVVGDDVHMFHGVTLGGDDPRPVERHPTVERGATLGANSTLVGDITVGTGGTVGAGAVVTEDVPAGATVVGNPARVVDEEPSPVAAESTTDERTPATGTTEPDTTQVASEVAEGPDPVGTEADSGRRVTLFSC